MPPRPNPFELLLTHDAFVRALARRLVGNANDADDLAQETWLAALRRAPDGGDRTRGWFASVVARLASNARRAAGRRRERERRAAVPSHSPPAIQAREEARRAVVDSVVRLPEPLRETVLLRFLDGLPPRAIATRQGIPTETVRSRLKRALALLREDLDRRAGGSGASWVRALTPWAFGNVGFVQLLGGFAMKKTALVTAAALLAVSLLTVGYWWEWGASNPEPPKILPAIATAPAVAAKAKPNIPAESRSERSEAAAPGAPVAADRGSLVIEVVGAATSRPAAGIQVLVVPPSLSGTIQLWRFGRQVTTDADGLARLEGLEPGFHQIRGDRGGMKGAKIRAGEETRVQVVLPRGFRIVGNALDEKRNPVPGAAIWLYEDESGDHPVHVTTAGPDGKFSIDEVSTDTWFPCVGARMDGYAPSTVFQVHAPHGGVQSLDLVLDSGAARLRGRVVDKVGNPVVGAFAFVSLPQKTGGDYQQSPPPLHALTDEDGRFAFAELARGKCTVAIADCGHGQLAPGAKGARPPAVFANGRFASWRQTIDTATSDDTSLEIRLGDGGFIVGTVTLSNGTAVPSAHVVETPMGPGRCGAMTAKDGSYTLGPLAAGDVSISVFSDVGKTQAKAVVEAGATVTCNPVIPSSASIVGIVVDESDTPQKGWSLMATSRDGGGLLTGLTDASGRFELKNAGDRTYTITAYAPGPGEDIPSAWAEDVGASTRDLTLRVTDATRRSCWIEGNLVDAAGSSIAGADIHIYARPTFYGGSHYSEEGTGHFKIGPLPPAEYSIEIVPSKAGRLRFPWKKLAPREHWDLGTLTLPAAGKLVLRYQRSAGVPAARPSIYLEGADGKPSGAAFADSSADGSRTEWVTAGDYWVHVGGEGFATDRIPCVVRAGEETSVDVPLRAGCRRWLALKNSIAGSPQIGARLEVREEGKEKPILSFESFGISAGKPLRFPVDLAPGTYEVRLTDNGARETKKTIVVKGAPEPAADIELELR